MTLSINRLVRVSVNLSPLAAARRGFGSLLVIGDSSVIDAGERIRAYTDIESIAGDFGTSAPEYLAAQLYFSQSPKPLSLYIGRWARTATNGVLRGGILTTTEQAMANWTAITTGTLSITVDGVAKNLTGLNFSAQTNLNGVASIINATLTGAVCSWDGSRFKITSNSTGATSILTYATGTISAQMKLTTSTALAPVNGIAAETPLAALTILADKSQAWYGLMFADGVMPTNDEIIACAGFIEASSLKRMFGVTETDTRVLDSAYTTDLATRLKDLGYKQSFALYSPNKAAVASLFGRAFSVNFSANRSTITLMYKQAPGVVSENLTETQAQTLKAKRCNVYAAYNNDTAIIQYGVMSGQAYFDEIHGLDWFADAVQNALYNLLYQTGTKIPQTAEGQNMLIAECAKVCNEAVFNGLSAGGTWNADGFGQLSKGDYLNEGFYIYSQPISQQAQSIREQRIAPPIQIALKLAGAFHEVDAIINVNR